MPRGDCYAIPFLSSGGDRPRIGVGTVRGALGRSCEAFTQQAADRPGLSQDRPPNDRAAEAPRVAQDDTEATVAGGKAIGGEEAAWAQVRRREGEAMSKGIGKAKMVEVPKDKKQSPGVFSSSHWPALQDTAASAICLPIKMVGARSKRRVCCPRRTLADPCSGMRSSLHKREDRLQLVS